MSLTNRRLLIHPGTGTQTFMNEAGNQAAVVSNTEQFGVVSYAGLDLIRMNRVEDKNFPGSGELIFGLNILDNPGGGRLTALARVAEVEKMIRAKLLHPIVDKLLRGEVLLRDAFGKPKPKEKAEEGEILPTEGNIKTFMTETGDGGAKAALQKDWPAAGRTPRAVKAELTEGENVLWIGPPEGSTRAGECSARCSVRPAQGTGLRAVRPTKSSSPAVGQTRRQGRRRHCVRLRETRAGDVLSAGPARRWTGRR